MSDVFIWVHESAIRNQEVVNDLEAAARTVVCGQPRVPIGGHNCWVRVVPCLGTKNVTIGWVAHYHANDPHELRTEEWAQAVTQELAKAVFAVMQRHFPNHTPAVSVDGSRIPFGPMNAYVTYTPEE